MNITLWAVTGLLAAAFLGAGLMKIRQPKVRLAASGMGWAEDFSPGAVKTLGVLQVAAAAGLILPAALDIAPVLVPLAALGLALMMIGAAVVHLRRREPTMVPPNIALFLLAAVVVWGRFGPYSF
ncbi:DoxX family protein [Streptomyces sp. NPDC058464]|uniref:DoxX family protein n=1 Tax=Streptomyces sp. NPDC058464 TaxID=3346511 RepID=UPI003663BE7A